MIEKNKLPNLKETTTIKLQNKTHPNGKLEHINTKIR